MPSARKEEPISLEEKYKIILKQLRVIIWKVVEMIPVIWEMPLQDFYYAFSEEINMDGKIAERNEYAIAKYAQRGIPKDISFEILSEYIENIFQVYMAGDYCGYPKKSCDKERIQEQWDRTKDAVMEILATFYKELELEKQNKKELGQFLTNEYLYFLFLQSITNKNWPVQITQLNEKETEFLKLALERFPPSFTMRKRNNSKTN